MASVLAAGAKKLGHSVPSKPFFDTVSITVGDAAKIQALAVAEGANVRVIDSKTVGISIDETTKIEDIDVLFKVLNKGKSVSFTAASIAPEVSSSIGSFARKSTYLKQPIFNTHHDEHSMLR